LVFGIFLQTAMAPYPLAQAGHGTKVNKGPRALGLLELSPSGKAYLIPVTIMIDGKFYDASAYKAAPVPMALWSETVYEGFRTGVSQGLFTVRDALQKKDAKDSDEWTGEGTWQSADSIKAKAAKKPVSSEPRGMNEDEGPPVLRRGSSEKPGSTESPATTTMPQTKPAAQASSPNAATTTVPQSGPAPTTPVPPPPATSTSSKNPQDAAPPEDKDRPSLKRGKPASMPAEQTQVQTSAKTAAPPATKTGNPTPSSATSPASVQANPVHMIPAISDANGPEARPYAYTMKPDYEQQLRKKMLGLAGEEVRAYIAATSGAPAPIRASPQRSKVTTAKPIQPEFEDVQLHVYDLADINEPEMVLTATARMPRSVHEKSTSPDVQYMVTLVAREDVNDEIHKALANITDVHHLDVVPRLDLIDAVDADGDGRADLLFRQVSDAGSAFVVYRVIGDRLYALFQGSLGR
jgi:hypothetical protein